VAVQPWESAELQQVIVDDTEVVLINEAGVNFFEINQHPVLGEAAYIIRNPFVVAVSWASSSMNTYVIEERFEAQGYNPVDYIPPEQRTTYKSSRRSVNYPL